MTQCKWLRFTAKHFHDEEAAFAELEAHPVAGWSGLPALRRLDRIYALKGVRTKPSKKNPEGVVRHGLKKCGHCRKQFTVRVGTVFEDSHVPLHKWFQAIHLMCSSKKGISSHQLHRILEVAVQHRVVHEPSHPRSHARRLRWPPMGGGGGIVEVDETFIGRKKRTTTASASAASQHKHVVLTLVERGGEVRSFHVDVPTSATIMPDRAREHRQGSRDR